MLKSIGIGLLLLITIFIGIGLVLPESTQVSRSIVIERDIDTVFSKLNNMREFNSWSPWAEYDPNTRYEFAGPDAGVGAIMTWKSENPSVGGGRQEIVSSVKNDKVSVDLMFEGQGSATAYYLVEEKSNNQTKVTWGFNTLHGYNIISRYMGLMFDEWIGAEYQKGLNKLKQVLEAKNR
ncbi:SRPBCC family protein [Flocculibacter collagenilyticus]|uniref:SRPBCC family protein n=1 Tax=Flocculibacter collagenilyticus TaxID=2744479 RepID=UPI0018F6A0AD|nr:SRPBCC family protein [Flocculibacter collagenilyticus]